MMLCRVPACNTAAPYLCSEVCCLEVVVAALNSNLGKITRHLQTKIPTCLCSYDTVAWFDRVLDSQSGQVHLMGYRTARNSECHSHCSHMQTATITADFCGRGTAQKCPIDAAQQNNGSGSAASTQLLSLWCCTTLHCTALLSVCTPIPANL
jgi:hypothetical protein